MSRAFTNSLLIALSSGMDMYDAVKKSPQLAFPGQAPFVNDIVDDNAAVADIVDNEGNVVVADNIDNAVFDDNVGNVACVGNVAYVDNVNNVDDAVVPDIVDNVDSVDDAVVPDNVYNVDYVDDAVVPDIVDNVDDVDDAVVPDIVDNVDDVDDAVVPDNVYNVDSVDNAAQFQVLTGTEHDTGEHGYNQREYDNGDVRYVYPLYNEEMDYELMYVRDSVPTVENIHEDLENEGEEENRRGFNYRDVIFFFFYFSSMWYAIELLVHYGQP